LIIPFAVFNFFVSTGMAFINTKFFDMSSTYAMSGGALIVLVGVVLLCDGWWSAGLIATRASLLQITSLLSLWEPRPRGDGWWSARLIATRASLLQITSLLPGVECSHKLKGACQ
jgi:hypothetical protein